MSLKVITAQPIAIIGSKSVSFGYHSTAFNSLRACTRFYRQFTYLRHILRRSTISTSLINTSSILNNIIRRRTTLNHRTRANRNRLMSINIQLVRLLRTKSRNTLRRLFGTQMLLRNRIRNLVQPINRAPCTMTINLRVHRRLSRTQGHTKRHIHMITSMRLRSINRFLTLFTCRVQMSIHRVLTNIRTILMTRRTTKIIINTSTFRSLVKRSTFRTYTNIPIRRRTTRIRGRINSKKINRSTPYIIKTIR